MAYFLDFPTSISFCVPKSSLPAHILPGIDKQFQLSPTERVRVQFHRTTPAGVFLYTHALIFGRIIKFHVEGAWKAFVERHAELGGDSWMCFLLAGLALAREAEDEWFERLVVGQIVRVTEAALGVGGGEGGVVA
jgi:hypothetical protein